eukprot:CAMPEP_0204100494 /NCGR_PEP_ID=MMETSP0360-20130528/193997_1 /ASSEMBLY_ACC=CAM_ASM_000342 /TAXON_ID=268821 /ORGANISM="Scrippsiella Hangoei, Strain SHTV-5" /LENGTH=115 /DNA_ID=CAMNT_0051049889 /DNA_START=421 /DNA_END=765 /DNA_ORIENTATION=+
MQVTTIAIATSSNAFSAQASSQPALDACGGLEGGNATRPRSSPAALPPGRWGSLSSAVRCSGSTPRGLLGVSQAAPKADGRARPPARLSTSGVLSDGGSPLLLAIRATAQGAAPM